MQKVSLVYTVTEIKVRNECLLVRAYRFQCSPDPFLFQQSKCFIHGTDHILN